MDLFVCYAILSMAQSYKSQHYFLEPCWTDLFYALKKVTVTTQSQRMQLAYLDCKYAKIPRTYLCPLFSGRQQPLPAAEHACT